MSTTASSKYCGECGQSKGCSDSQPAPAAAPEKKKKAPSTYNKFFSEKMQLESIRSLPHKERMAKIGEMWKAEKESSTAAAQPPAAAPSAAAPQPVVHRV